MALGPLLEQTRADWERRLAETLSRQHFVLGEQVASFEQEFARAMGARYAVGVGTGTAAIEVCLRAAGLTDSTQEVITSALTSPFTAQAVLAAGATPRFTDIHPDTLQVDSASVEERVTKRTAALLPVHLYGQPCEMSELTKLARQYKLAVVQDACQAHGASVDGKPFPAFSPYVAYSFYPTKNLGCLGDGGAVVTNSARVAEQLRLLRDGGRKGDQLSRIPAINSRLDEIQASFLRAFLPHLEEWNRQRAELASVYDEALHDCEGVRPVRRTSSSVNHLYVARVQRREELRAWLLHQGIQTGIHYPVPLHLHPAFRQAGKRQEKLPHAERACREIVSLPLRPMMPVDDARYVAEQIRRFYQG